jgi:hypothetical protein
MDRADMPKAGRDGSCRRLHRSARDAPNSRLRAPFETAADRVLRSRLKLIALERVGGMPDVGGVFWWPSRGVGKCRIRLALTLPEASSESRA